MQIPKSKQIQNIYKNNKLINKTKQNMPIYKISKQNISQLLNNQDKTKQNISQ